MTAPVQNGELPLALDRETGPWARLEGKRPAVFLDYDGTLTPIVERPEDARITDSMREAVRQLADRCPVCVVSGRDRPVVQELMGVRDLIVAASHGFDIWSPHGGVAGSNQGIRYRGLMEDVGRRLGDQLAGIAGAHLELKSASVAVHYRSVAEADRPAITRIVDRMLLDHGNSLKVTPGKMVYELQPNIEWNKGRAVLHLLSALDLDGEDVMPIYIGDDLTDEHAFEALAGRGISILVGSADDPELLGRATSAGYRLPAVNDVEQFLRSLAVTIVQGRAVGGQ